MLRAVKLYGTTDGTDGTAGALSVTFGHKITGELKAVHWIDGDLADGVDAVISIVADDVEADTTLLTLTDANVDAWYFPKVTADDGTGGAIATEFVDPIVNGKPKLVVSSGGNGKSGGCIIFYEA
jgi:hypothetical protein